MISVHWNTVQSKIINILWSHTRRSNFRIVNHNFNITLTHWTIAKPSVAQIFDFSSLTLLKLHQYTTSRAVGHRPSFSKLYTRHYCSNPSATNSEGKRRRNSPTNNVTYRTKPIYISNGISNRSHLRHSFSSFISKNIAR